MELKNETLYGNNERVSIGLWRCICEKEGGKWEIRHSVHDRENDLEMESKAGK